MAYQQLENLPQDIKDQLPQDAQQIFMAAFNGAESDGISESGAQEVAWNTIKHDYRKGDDGKWHRYPQETTDHSPLGSIRNS